MHIQRYHFLCVAALAFLFGGQDERVGGGRILYCEGFSPRLYSARSVMPFSLDHGNDAQRNVRNLNLMNGGDTGSIDTNDGSSKSKPTAVIVGLSPTTEESVLEDLVRALYKIGYPNVVTELTNGESSTNTKGPEYRYQYSMATGMLKLLSSPSTSFDPPRWVPVVAGEENILVANGWSFLDPDESEPASAFDVDAANDEGLYKPKWGSAEEGLNDENASGVSCDSLSTLGYDLTPMSFEQVQSQADKLLLSLSRTVLLEGKTDPPNEKQTNNGYDFSGSVRQTDIQEGTFMCAIGGLPLFSSLQLSPTTSSSGWLSFSLPISDDHILHIQPKEGAADKRIEVICAKSKCHLGHYFGKSEGYCINASALNFVPKRSHDNVSLRSTPVSWRNLDQLHDSPSIQLLVATLRQTMQMETIVLGAGCFWHVELALRRLPGVVSTKVGYTGGTTTSPTYQDVCKKETGHAEVVAVRFDPTVLQLPILLDCFFAMHDPTMVRSLGNRAKETGQYRSCIFLSNKQMKEIAMQSLDGCAEQLGKLVSTEVRLMDTPMDDWFWPAEERHQRHDERTKGNTGDDIISTLSATQWLKTYGRRADSIWGTAQTLDELSAQEDPRDDGMARMMI